MAGMYPSLQEKFKHEGICPICMMVMGVSPKYSCVNRHTMCHRCKPYYYACPTCQSPLNIEFPPADVAEHHMPPPMHYMPHPYPPQYPPGNMPTAPFLDQERYNWKPPSPVEGQELKHCGFCHAGCEARFPEHLRQIHESRCQFRPNLEEEQLPTDLRDDDETLLDCRYHIVGCNVRLSDWRKRIHEEICIYKDKVEDSDAIENSFEQLSFEDNSHGDPNELVECRFRRQGCMVRMPRRRKHTHEQNCNWSKYESDDDNCEVREYSEPEQDPDQRVPCVWAEYGCQVMPRVCRKESHEDNCNYKMVHCSNRRFGCNAMFQPARRYAHEKSCQYA